MSYNYKLLHICNVEQLVIASHYKLAPQDRSTIYAVFSWFTLFGLTQYPVCRNLCTFVWTKSELNIPVFGAKIDKYDVYNTPHALGSSGRADPWTPEKRSLLFGNWKIYANVRKSWKQISREKCINHVRILWQEDNVFRKYYGFMFHSRFKQRLDTIRRWQNDSEWY